MKNVINWETGENGSLPMVLEEKGLGLKGSYKFLFYFCASISLLSMIWVIVISVGVYASVNKDPTLPEYYRMVAIGCIALSGFCINSLLKFYKDKKNYYKHIEIYNGKIKFKEVTTSKKSEWEERIRKYSSVDLRHYNYRGESSWYVLLQHHEKEKKVVLFAPEYKYQNATEETKREVLSFYGKLFNLPTNYLDLEASYKATHHDEAKQKEEK